MSRCLDHPIWVKFIIKHCEFTPFLEHKDTIKVEFLVSVNIQRVSVSNKYSCRYLEPATEAKAAISDRNERKIARFVAIQTRFH